MLNDIALQTVRLQVDGAEITTYSFGPDDEDSVGDVVFCHGTPWSAMMWLPVARVLADRYRVFLWDMPGYGASITHATPPVDLIHQRKRLKAVLEYWQLDRPNIVAHDIGGAVALGTHLFEGGIFASLYLLDAVTLDPWGSPFFRLVAEHEEAFAALPPNLHAALVREYIAGAAVTDLDTTWLDELARPWCSHDGQVAFYRQITQLAPSHTRPIIDNLEHVRCPTRIGWGEGDLWIPVRQAFQLGAALPPPVEVVTFPDTGHLVPLEASYAVSQDIVRWLVNLARQ